MFRLKIIINEWVRPYGRVPAAAGTAGVGREFCVNTGAWRCTCGGVLAGVVSGLAICFAQIPGPAHDPTASPSGARRLAMPAVKTGRAACRERVCQYV